MWKLEANAEYKRGVKKWPKKYRRELLAMHDNLDTLVGILNQGTPIEQIHCGFIHNEPRGVKAIDQRGAGKGVKQSRLYIFPDVNTRIVHLITIGDKDSQKTDVQYAAEFVDNLST